jgi:putative flippase GtrA
MSTRLALRQFGLFLLIGGGAAVCNFGAGALVRLISTSALVLTLSVVAGHVVGTVVSFVLNRRFTFAVSDERVGPQAWRFAVASLGGLVVVAFVTDGLAWLWGRAGSPLVSRSVAESVAHAAAIGVNTVYSFVIVKFFALKRRGLSGSQA